MTQLQKLVRKIFTDSVIRYNEAEKILLHLGYRLRITSSHHIFKKDNAKQIVLKKRAELLEYQVIELRGAILNYEDNKEN